jgi:hypothetical protein
MWTSARAVKSSVSFPSARILLVPFLAVVVGVAMQVSVGQAIIASKQGHNLKVSLLSKSGQLDRKDEYCVLFSRTNAGEPTEVGDVSVDFAQQVGRIRESPREFPFSPEGTGRYCGEVDLGKQYYQPAFYYVIVHYADGSRKRRACRFFLTIKEEKRR